MPGGSQVIITQRGELWGPNSMTFGAGALPIVLEDPAEPAPAACPPACAAAGPPAYAAAGPLGWAAAGPTFAANKAVPLARTAAHGYYPVAAGTL